MDEVPSAVLVEEVLLEPELDAVFDVTEFALCPSTGALIFGLIPCIFNCFFLSSKRFRYARMSNRCPLPVFTSAVGMTPTSASTGTAVLSARTERTKPCCSLCGELPELPEEDADC